MKLLQLVVVSYTDAFEDISDPANPSTPADPNSPDDPSTPADTAVIDGESSGAAAGLSLSVENKER